MNSAEYRKMYEAEGSHWWYVTLHETVLDCIMKERATDGRSRILDAGCGTGRLCEILSPLGETEGCDIYTGALQYSAMRGISVFRADLNDSDLGQEQYDIITSIDVLYHSWIADDRTVVSALYRALKPGGLLVLQVPAFEWLRSSHDIAVHTVRRYRRGEVAKMLTDTGFLLQRSTYRVCLLFAPIAISRIASRYLSFSKKGPEERSDVRHHSRPVNALLTAVMRMENRLLRSFSLPFGTSIFMVARKPRMMHKTSGHSQ